jgi:serine protease Do/serine protease DegQ
MQLIHSKLIKFQRTLTSFLVLVMLSLSIHTTAALPERLIEGSSVPSLAPIISGAAPAVVNIATYTVRAQRSPLMQSPFFRRFFSLPEQPSLERRTQSAGSGVIIDAKNGYVLTNHHVIEDSDEIEVTMQNGRSFAAKLIGSDKQVDLALLQIPAEDLVSIEFADSDSISVGDFVLAIGSPFGLQQSVTSGIISALGRNGLGIQGYEDFIQTDASINPGNSGGALIDLNGRLIGINSAIIAPAGGNVGIGFAIPSKVVQAVMTQLIRYGEVKRGGIGTKFQDLTPELAEAFGLKQYQGALVALVDPNGPAAASGLMQGDVVIKASGRAIKSASDMNNKIGLSPLGETLVLDIIREEKSAQVRVTISEIPTPEASGLQVHPLLAGSHLQDLIPPDLETAIGIMLLRVDNNSAAAIQGFEVGDIIFGVNQTRIKSIAQLQRYLGGNPLTSVHIRRGYQEYIVYIR